MSTLIIAAHPDDEVLGAGGWMAKHPGCHVAILSEGTSARYTDDAGLKHRDHETALLAKRQATKRALDGLHAHLVYEGSFLDQRLSLTDLGLHRVIADLLTTHQPSTVLTHHPHELNADHRVVAEVVSIMVRAFTPTGRKVREVLSFAVDAWAQPGHSLTFNTFCMMRKAELQAKLAALAHYADELRPWPHPRNPVAIEAYHRWLGAVTGGEAAEPYLLLWGRA